MADDTKRDPPKLTLLKGGGTHTTQTLGPPEPAPAAGTTQAESEAAAFTLFQQVCDGLMAAEKLMAKASQLTQVEQAQAQGKAPAKLYASSFFEALGAMRIAMARVVECREAVRHHVLDDDTPPKGKRRGRRGSPS